MPTLRNFMLAIERTALVLGTAIVILVATPLTHSRVNADETYDETPCPGTACKACAKNTDGSCEFASTSCPTVSPGSCSTECKCYNVPPGSTTCKCAKRVITGPPDDP